MIPVEKEVTYISYKKALSAQRKGTGIIIDVREPAEFRDGHLPNSINLPSTNFHAEDYRPWRHLKVFLICQSGKRAQATSLKLCEAGMEEIYVLDRHMEQIDLEASPKGWSVDRQFRFVLGVFLAVFLVGFYWLSDWFAVIPVILCLGLTITSIIDKCYLRIGIAKMPWNQEKTTFELRNS